MKLTDRDFKIIDFIEKNKGATIEQIQKIFFPSYDVAANRLKIMADNKHLKVAIHPTLGKKVYYIHKLPSYHALIINDIAIKLWNQIKYMQREYKIGQHKVDCLIITNENKLIVLEIDIYNRTSEQKVDAVSAALKNKKIDFEFWLITKGERNKKLKGINYITI